MAKNRATTILHIMKDNISVPRRAGSTRDPFQTLIRTVLSQATADRNTVRTFENLSGKFFITPKALANASLKKIEEAIKVGGLYRNKSRVIKAISREILRKFNGSLDFIHLMPLEEAREALLDLPGVGPKTADVVLLFCAKRPTFPVDTHVNRVSKRLGLASAKDDYERVRRSLEALYQSRDYLLVHLLLIALGRIYCKARKPLCRSCPVNLLCPSKDIGD